MNDRHSILAFCAILIAICYLATVAAILAWNGKYAEALGFGGLTTGLVGVIGTFRPKTTGASDAQDDALKTAIDKIPPKTGAAAVDAVAE